MNASHGNGVVIIDNDKKYGCTCYLTIKSKTVWTKRQQANSDPLYAEITIQAGQQDTAIV